jgi:hypothetical protein
MPGARPSVETLMRSLVFTLIFLSSGNGIWASAETANHESVVDSQPNSTSKNSTLSPIICAPSQLDTLSQEVVKTRRKQLCVQKDILQNLQATGADLAKAAHTSHLFPEAEGANAITCRNPPPGFGDRFRQPAWMCAFNSYWRELDYALRHQPWSNYSSILGPYVGSTTFQGVETTTRP